MNDKYQERESAIITLLIFFVVILAVGGNARAETPSHAIQSKDGAKCAAMFDDAVRVNIRPELRAKLAPIVAAIRYAENGTTYQYGIIHKRCKAGYRNQAGWCAATVQKNWDRWQKAGAKGEFISYLGGIYCPIGADNDPNGLNHNWIGNVRKFKKRFASPPKRGIMGACSR